MNENVNKSALFNGSCFALITTAFTFSIRAGILPQLGEAFGLSAEQLGFINSMWFLGFPISMIIGGLVYHTFGPKNIMMVAFVCHTTGILLTIFAGGYTTLLISTLLIGIGNGCTEAACNPMIADMYSGVKMQKMLARFHMWFPGGILVGSLISFFMTRMGFGWEAQMWVTMIPTIIYAVLFYGKAFPKPQLEEANSLAENFKAMLSPVYIFLFLLHGPYGYFGVWSQPMGKYCFRCQWSRCNANFSFDIRSIRYRQVFRRTSCWGVGSDRCFAWRSDPGNHRHLYVQYRNRPHGICGSHSLRSWHLLFLAGNDWFSGT